MTNRPYLVQLSNKTEVKIDSDELDKITQGIQAGSPIRLKRGIVNPSFIIAIVQDTERWSNFLHSVPGASNSDDFKREMERRKIEGCVPLSDIFDRTPLALNADRGFHKPELITEPRV